MATSQTATYVSRQRFVDGTLRIPWFENVAGKRENGSPKIDGGSTRELGSGRIEILSKRTRMRVDGDSGSSSPHGLTEKNCERSIVCALQGTRLTISFLFGVNL